MQAAKQMAVGHVVRATLFLFCSASNAAEWHVVENIDAVAGAGLHSKNLGRVDDTGKAGLQKCQVPTTFVVFEQSYLTCTAHEF